MAQQLNGLGFGSMAGGTSPNSLNTAEIVTELKAANKNMSQLIQVLMALSETFANVFPRITGTFTMGAAATTVVNTTSVTANSLIELTPTNASAAVLQGSNECLYVSTRSPGVSFTVATGAGTAAAGTETFQYTIQNPV